MDLHRSRPHTPQDMDQEVLLQSLPDPVTGVHLPSLHETGMDLLPYLPGMDTPRRLVRLQGSICLLLVPLGNMHLLQGHQVDMGLPEATDPTLLRVSDASLNLKV